MKKQFNISNDKAATKPIKLVVNTSLDFTPDNLAQIFENVENKPCKAIGYDYVWNITENGRFAGELFYSNEFREWSFIKDNYPAPRKAYTTTFPMDADLFVRIFKAINIDLKLNII